MSLPRSDKAEAELAGTGRVLLRSSGTEPLVRVMVEASDADQARRVADALASWSTIASRCPDPNGSLRTGGGSDTTLDHCLTGRPATVRACAAAAG